MSTLAKDLKAAATASDSSMLPYFICVGIISSIVTLTIAILRFMNRRLEIKVQHKKNLMDYRAQIHKQCLEEKAKRFKAVRQEAEDAK
ncbi:hypothetical protein ABMY44_13700 [Pseudoalteromonas sp. Cnat2-41]|uniref:hypothetical protein n=1 Tax=unclassified Pseudoalteromonas TaxID=194690 RepID=UPI001EF8748A|nr:MULTISPECIES: hypothetical protein [unclassified Pseudoalteromonas]MCF2862482.1 hypothetical protein [Pseudoalteromonas sp. CNAT2-18]MCG7559066.1 hypothetical protein [Pseudoalteromonas sp. CNAT2-18.1]